jgi:uncharacterized membrane protein
VRVIGFWPPASPDDAQWTTTSTITWMVVLIAVVILGGFVVKTVRTRLRPKPGDQATVSFDIKSLRDMRDRGELTQAEFKKACEHVGREAREESSPSR